MQSCRFNIFSLFLIFIGTLNALLVFCWNIKSSLDSDLLKGVNKLCRLLWHHHWGAQIDIFFVKFRQFISWFVFFKRSTHWYRWGITIVSRLYWLRGTAYLLSKRNFNFWVIIVTCLIYYIIIGLYFARFGLFLIDLIRELKWLISFEVILSFLSLAHKTWNIRSKHVIVNFNPIFELV